MSGPLWMKNPELVTICWYEEPGPVTHISLGPDGSGLGLTKDPGLLKECTPSDLLQLCENIEGGIKSLRNYSGPVDMDYDETGSAGVRIIFNGEYGNVYGDTLRRYLKYEREQQPGVLPAPHRLSTMERLGHADKQKPYKALAALLCFAKTLGMPRVEKLVEDVFAEALDETPSVESYHRSRSDGMVDAAFLILDPAMKFHELTFEVERQTGNSIIQRLSRYMAYHLANIQNDKIPWFSDAFQNRPGLVTVFDDLYYGGHPDEYTRRYRRYCTSPYCNGIYFEMDDPGVLAAHEEPCPVHDTMFVMGGSGILVIELDPMIARANALAWTADFSKKRKIDEYPLFHAYPTTNSEIQCEAMKGLPLRVRTVSYTFREGLAELIRGYIDERLAPDGFHSPFALSATGDGHNVTVMTVHASPP